MSRPRSKQDIPTRRVVGVIERLCRGPLHPRGEWLPESAFYSFITNYGKLYTRKVCKECYNRRRRPYGWVRYQRIAFVAEELVNRLGFMEATRRANIAPSTLRKYLRGESRYVYRPTARRLICALHEARKNNEVRHRASIHHGSTMRGKKERIPRERKDLYRPHGDDYSEAKRRLVANMSEERREIIRARDRERRRQK